MKEVAAIAGEYPAWESPSNTQPFAFDSDVVERLCAYKYPRRIWLLDELPKGATGKVQKRDITAPTSERAP